MKSVRQQRKREQMVDEILTTARQIMREEGAAALSMQELARRLDIKAPSLYNYFSGKHDVYDAVFRLGYELFDARMEARARDARTWQEEFRLYVETYMAFAIENPELYQLCFERPVPGFVPSDDSLQFSFGVLHKAYEAVGRWRDHIKTELTDQQIGDLMIALMHGLTALCIANEPGLPVGQGRFGGLIPAAVSLFATSWSKTTGAEGDVS